MADRIANASHAVCQSGGAIAVISAVAGWLVENHVLVSVIGVLIGVALSIAGFCVSWYYKQKQTRILEMHYESNHHYDIK